MRSRERKSITAALGLLDADSITGGGLASDGDVGFADHQALRLDYPADAEDHRAWAFGLDCLPQAAGTGVVEIGDEENSAAASALGISAIAFRAGERQCAATNGG